MYYRIKDETLHDYADYKYEAECLEIPEYTAEYVRENYEAFQIRDGILVNIENTAEYQVISNEKSKKERLFEIEKELNELDLKRIRAIAEPELKDPESGETWLEHYNKQITQLRTEYAGLA